MIPAAPAAARVALVVAGAAAVAPRGHAASLTAHLVFNSVLALSKRALAVLLGAKDIEALLRCAWQAH